MLRKKYVNQAVVLADSFDRRYSPITVDFPRSLVPLVNVPLIDYTLELLVSAGVERIYVFCVHQADKLLAYLNSSRWMSTAGLQIRPVVSNKARTVGDALRRMHAENVIESDFILVHGDLVGHVKLDEVLLAHRMRKEKDPTTLMTTVYMRASPSHASRSLEDDTLVGLTAENQIIFWENQPTSSSVEIDPQLIQTTAHGSLRLRYDLLDTFVDICSVEVLQLFMDNFDYQNLRTDFMQGTLGDDITENKLFAHILDNQYATRCKDLRTYASVSRDVIHRWTAPVVVDSPLLKPDASYRLLRGLLYRERNVATHPTTRLGSDTVIGSGTTIGARTILQRTVVGRNCRIGAGCVISNSFLWDGVVVEDNCVIDWGIVCSRAHVHHGVTTGKGCVLSFGVHVGPAIELKPHTRVTLNHVQGSALGLPDSEEVTRNADLGDKGCGVLWVLQEDEESNALHQSGRKALQLGETPEEVDDDGDEPVVSETDDSDLLDGGAGGTDFDFEVREIVGEGVKASSAIENLVLEINGRKFAHDKSFFECARAILWSLLASVPEGVEQGKPLLAQVQRVLKTWHPLLAKFVPKQDQTELLWTLQEYVEFKDHARYASVFQFLLHQLYDLEVVEEDAIWAWEKEQHSLVGPDRKYLEQCAKFFQWLAEAEESSD